MIAIVRTDGSDRFSFHHNTLRISHDIVRAATRYDVRSFVFNDLQLLRPRFILHIP
jgi:hypothetical protein